MAGTARRAPLWQFTVGFAVCMLVVNVLLGLEWGHSRHQLVELSNVLPVSPVLLANADLRLAGWMNEAGSTSQPPTVIGSYERLRAAALEGAEQALPAISVAVVVDPRTFAADCMRAGTARHHCIEEALTYFDLIAELTAAPLHPGIPLPMAEEGSVRNEVLTSHHGISCWPASNGGDSVRAIIAAGGRCVLLLDALDIHSYPRYSNAALKWFIEEASITDERVLAGDRKDGGQGQAHGHVAAKLAKRVLQIRARHNLYMTTVDGRWGDFNDVLRAEELEEVEERAWDWLVAQDMAVDASDVFYVFIMYAEHELSTWKRNIEAMALSIQKNGGALKKASGALLVYTPHGEKQPNLTPLVPLLEANNIAVVFMPTPWKEDMSDAWSLHFLKTDVASYLPAWQHQVVMFLDLDMLVLGDIVPFMSPRHLRMTPATTIVTMTGEQWRRHGFTGEGERTMHHLDTMEAAYYNSGVMMAPAKVLAAFLGQTEVEAEIELEAGEHALLTRDQLMFEFAHYRLEPPFLELPHDANLDSALAVTAACQVLAKPVIYHYHRNPLLRGAPSAPPRGSCPAYDHLRESLLSLKQYYRTEGVLGN